MPSTRDIRRRIRSIRNTAQITKAMQMVAAAKMRKAQQAAVAGRPYAGLMNSVMAEVTANAGDYVHPLMAPRPSARRAVVIVSTDKGLCGSLNSNLMREAGRFEKESTIYVCAGKKGAQFVARTKRRLAAEFTYKDAPLFAEARAISKFAQNLFLDGEVSRVDILFTNFISTLNQKVELRPFLPVGEITPFPNGRTQEAAAAGELTMAAPGASSQPRAGGGLAPPPATLPTGAVEFLFEPSAGEVFANLLPHYLNFHAYQILLEAKASEHSARMVAMKNATDNANQLIKDLTLEYNKLRQANITKELLEIASAAMALQ